VIGSVGLDMMLYLVRAPLESQIDVLVEKVKIDKL
jgi:hypothetical protein